MKIPEKKDIRGEKHVRKGFYLSGQVFPLFGFMKEEDEQYITGAQHGLSIALPAENTMDLIVLYVTSAARALLIKTIT